jgi:tetratricopeptide (TPR) repeat protein
LTDGQASAPHLTADTEPAARRYSAFISYTDADRVLALRLQSRLERYRLPARLARQVGYSRIKPVFVDRSEMRAAPDLGDAIRQALARSEHLIVLCTPRTPASHWVGREIDTFRELHGGANVLVALFEGHKADCFHERLLVDGENEPLAADFRPGGDGRLALLKVVAALVEVDLDELVHRDGKRQRRKTVGIGSVAAAIALTIGALSLWAWSSDRAVDRGRTQASLAMQNQLDDLRKRIKAGGTLDMAAAVNRNVELFYDELPTSDQLPEVDLGRAKLLQAKAEDDKKRRDFASAAANAREAWKYSARVLAKKPADPKAIFVHAQSAYWVGYIAWLQRDTPLAANAFARYADLADRLVKADPRNNDYRLEQGYAYSNLGTIALREARDPERARRYFSAAQAAFGEAARRDPGNPDPLYEMADGESWLAGVELARGDFAAAQQHSDRQAKLIADLLRRDPGNREYRVDHLSHQIGQARLDAERGRDQLALNEFRAAHDEAGELFAADPENSWLAGQKRAIELFQAQTLLKLGGASSLASVEAILAGCAADWTASADTELPPFCSILSARVALKRGDSEVARRIMADPRLASWLRSPSLSPTWRLDLPAECRKLGDPKLCG